MKNLRLIPDTHRQQAIVKVAFAYDLALIDLIKKQTDAKWSQSLKSWYFIEKDFHLNTFYQVLKGRVFVDYSKLKKSLHTTPLSKKTIKEKKHEIQLPRGFKEQLILK